MAGIWDFLNPTKKKKLTDQNDLEAVVSPKPENFLQQFLPQDETKRDALSKALIRGGAHAMMAGGPSSDPKSLLGVLGAGLAGGLDGYDANMESAADAAYKGAAVSANSHKQQQAAQQQTLMAGWYQKWGTDPGPDGYPPEAIAELSQIRAEVGDDEGFRMLMKNVQQLQQTGAEKGFVIGENGFQLAPGWEQGLFDTKKAESLGNAVGQNAQTTADQKDYQFGQDNPDFIKYEKSKIPGLNPGTAKFLEEGGKQAAERVSNAQKEAQNAKTLSADVQKMAEISRQIGSGKLAELKNRYGPYLQSMGIEVEGLNEGQLLESMTSRVAPSLRVPGSGSSTDLDVQMFVNSIPSLSKTPEGNQLIADTTTAVSQHKQRAAEIYSRTLDANDELYGNYNEAERQIAALPNPYEAFNKTRGKSGANTSDPAVTGSTSDAAPAKGDRLPSITSEAEFNALPSGTVFMKGGKRYRKP